LPRLISAACSHTTSSQSIQFWSNMSAVCGEYVVRLVI
jgi:hypothetical protein